MLPKDFKETVHNKDFVSVKKMMKNSLTMDLSFKQFQEMLDYILKYQPEIIEKHDGKLFEEKENWDERYSSVLKVDLLENFSAERIEHIKDVHIYIYRDEIQVEEEYKIEEENSGTTPNKNTLIFLITTIGVAAASIVFGLIRDMSILTIATSTVIVTCFIGGITYYLVKNK